MHEDFHGGHRLAARARNIASAANGGRIVDFSSQFVSDRAQGPDPEFSPDRLLDGQVLRAFQKGAETGGLILMHAENGIAIDVLIEQALARGQTDPRYHGIVRHELLEAEATHRAIKLAQVANAPVYIVHLSAEKALAEVAKARDEGYNAFDTGIFNFDVPTLDIGANHADL